MACPSVVGWEAAWPPSRCVRAPYGGRPGGRSHPHATRNVQGLGKCHTLAQVTEGPRESEPVIHTKRVPRTFWPQWATAGLGARVNF